MVNETTVKEVHWFLVTGSNGPEVVQGFAAERAMQAYKLRHGVDSWVTSCTWEGK